MSEAHKRVLLAANAAVAEGDHDGFLRHCTDDTEWTFVGDRTLRGKAEVRAFMDEAYREPPRVGVDLLVAEGDAVVAMGSIAVLGPDGTWKRQAYCDVWRLRDGLLASLRAFVV